MQEFFRAFSQKTSETMGKPWAFVVAVLVICLWASMGKIFNFSDTWQLVINTSTTIVTFLMVFLIQNTQNRDARVTGLKLDEIIRAVKGARDGIIQLEDLSDLELNVLEQEFQLLQQHHGQLQHSLVTIEKAIKAHHKIKKKRKAH